MFRFFFYSLRPSPRLLSLPSTSLDISFSPFSYTNRFFHGTIMAHLELSAHAC